MTDHNEGLLGWVSAQLGSASESISLTKVSGDASQDQYFRVVAEGSSGQIAVDSPNTENNSGFLHVQRLFEVAGVRVPKLVASDLDRGFWLIEDFGRRSLFDSLSVDNADSLYGKSLDLMAQIAAVDQSSANLPHYDEALLKEELERCVEWFFVGLLGLEMDSIARAYFDGLASVLVDNAVGQPQVVVHRDFHSRNVMCLEDESVAVIDFQDAVIGPLSYDPVSLLKDCYIGWTRTRQLELLEHYRNRLIESGVIPFTSNETFALWYDLMGLQRHIKVLGQFARLHLRDGRSEYKRLISHSHLCSRHHDTIWGRHS